MSEAVKKHKVSESRIYAWRKHFGQIEAADIKRLKTLEQASATQKAEVRIAGTKVKGLVSTLRIGGHF